jgi:hypothetical protein
VNLAASDLEIDVVTRFERAEYLGQPRDLE